MARAKTKPSLTEVKKERGTEEQVRPDVVKLLQECHNACRRMFMDYAPKEGGHNLSYLHLKRLQACIEICGATASYLLKDGVYAYRLCSIAARICEQCADSCEKVGDDAYFQRCARLCRDTAQACLEEGHRLRMLTAA